MLRDLKNLLGIDLEEDSLDDKLNWILSSTTSRLKLLLGGITPPPEMEYIIIEVSVIRYNRMGSEGMSSISIEGESNTFNKNDFEEYSDEIQAFLDSQKGNKRGKVRFL